VKEQAPFSTVTGGPVDQLENERSVCHDALAAREKIMPNNADSGGIDFYWLEDADRGMVVHLLYEYTDSRVRSNWKARQWCGWRHRAKLQKRQ
jgi:hypothetical protein